MENAIIEAMLFLDKAEKKVDDKYRLNYHLMPRANWINDPNGMICYKGVYHLFYQHNPFSEVWGKIYWGHATSTDLVNWKHEKIALAPTEYFDQDGCFSGTAAIDSETGKMIVTYTGHRWIDREKDLFKQEQCIAMSEDGINFSKSSEMLNLEIPKDSSHHIRDPKLWFENGKWNLLLGNSTVDRDGRVILYRSENLVSWDYKGILIESKGLYGYMFECPDFFKLDGKSVLITSPQGMEVKGDRYKNLHQAGYFIGDFDYQNVKFRHEGFKELDYGFDFYAPQTLLDGDGRRILIAWMDMWESEMPTQKDGWCGAMTLPRELELKGNIVLMKPVSELKSLRDNQNRFEDMKEITLDLNYSQELVIKNQEESFKIEFGCIEECESSVLSVDFESNLIIFSREYKSKNILRGERRINIDKDKVDLQIFIDKSSIEIFINNGEKVSTNRIYPKYLNDSLRIVSDDRVKNIEIFNLKNIW